jgi:hypothetical protein
VQLGETVFDSLQLIPERPYAVELLPGRPHEPMGHSLCALRPKVREAARAAKRVGFAKKGNCRVPQQPLSRRHRSSAIAERSTFPSLKIRKADATVSSFEEVHGVLIKAQPCPEPPRHLVPISPNLISLGCSKRKSAQNHLYLGSLDPRIPTSWNQ